MPATIAGSHLGPDIHANRPAANAAGQPVGALYSCTTHGLIYKTDGSSWSTYATLGGGGVADQGTFTYFDATEAAAPGTPASGKARIYAKADGRFYSKDDAGAESGPFDAAGAGGPLLYRDSLALHADGDEFADPTLAAWTLGGGLTTGDVSAITTEPYDATCLDVVYAAQLDRMLRALPGGGWSEIVLTCHGQTDATSPANSTAAMLGLCLVDAAGAGTGLSFYVDGATYTWAISGYGYAGSGAAVPNQWTTVNGGLAANNYPWMYRFRKSGTNVFGGVSYNGGLTWSETTAIAIGALVYNRFGIIRLYTGGGATTTLRIGRINVVP